MTYYTGIDVSLRSVSICVVDASGEVRHEAKVPAEIDDIVDCLKRFSPEIKSVGFEAGTLTQYLTYGLQAAGFEVVCLEARQVSVTLAAMRNKTDRNDARGLAQILRTGWYSRVHVKSLHSHQYPRTAGQQKGDPDQVHRSGERASRAAEGLWSSARQSGRARLIRWRAARESSPAIKRWRARSCPCWTLGQCSTRRI